MRLPSVKDVALAAATVGLLACGGRALGGPDGGPSNDAGAFNDGGGNGDGGWSNCEAPNGVSICGGPNQCGADCTQCAPTFPSQDAGTLRACDSSNYAVSAVETWECPDGTINACWEDYQSPGCWTDDCAEQEIGELYARNGQPDLARYADRSTYTGELLPAPTTSCPTMPPGLNLCGGACGTCSGNDVCTGRSPLHPISLCIDGPPSGFWCVRSDQTTCTGLYPDMGCLTYKVDDAAQSIADGNGMCVSMTLCQAAAQSYPGGAFCN